MKNNYKTAIENVCAWPSLHKNTEGELVVFVFDQPSHSFWEGDIQCWKSKDKGETWQYESHVTRHEAGTNRMNVACGTDNDGNYMVLVSGWTGRIPSGTRQECDWIMNRDASRIQPLTCRSYDNCKTWEYLENFPQVPAQVEKDRILTPFGKIAATEGHKLSLSAYAPSPDGFCSYFLRSNDNGLSWETPVVINPKGNETSVLSLGEGKWLAASREEDMHVELFVSNDDGKTWTKKMPLTLPKQAPGDFLWTQDKKKLIYAYGNRCKGAYGIDLRFSEDMGESWSAPVKIADSPDKDSGYPSSVMLSEDEVITVYYTRLENDFSYEMRSIIWNISDIS